MVTTRKFVQLLEKCLAKFRKKEEAFEEGSELLYLLSGESGETLALELKALLDTAKVAKKLQAILDKIEAQQICKH